MQFYLADPRKINPVTTPPAKKTYTIPREKNIHDPAAKKINIHDPSQPAREKNKHTRPPGPARWPGRVVTGFLAAGPRKKHTRSRPRKTYTTPASRPAKNTYTTPWPASCLGRAVTGFSGQARKRNPHTSCKIKKTIHALSPARSQGPGARRSSPA